MTICNIIAFLGCTRDENYYWELLVWEFFTKLTFHKETVKHLKKKMYIHCTLYQKFDSLLPKFL